VLLAVVTGSAVVTLIVAGRAAHRHPAVRSMLLAIASGIAFGMSSVFTKTVAVDWTGGVSLADVPSLAVIGVLATAGMLLSQASYRGAGLAAPLATLTVINPIVAAAVGITMFGETFRYGETGTALALGCGVVAAGGLILLTTERISGSERTAPVSVPAPAPVPVQAVAGAMADAAVRTEPGPAAEPSRIEEPAAVPPDRALPEQLVPAERLVVSAGVRDETRTREETLAHAGMFASASARQDSLLPPPGSNGPPPSGDTPDDIEGIDEPSWPNGGYYGLPFLPLLPAPVVIRSSVKS